MGEEFESGLEATGGLLSCLAIVVYEGTPDKIGMDKVTGGFTYRVRQALYTAQTTVTYCTNCSAVCMKGSSAASQKSTAHKPNFGSFVLT